MDILGNEGCADCEDCVYCENCKECDTAHNSQNCVKCKEIKNCKDCIECNYSLHCKRCEKCENMQYCEGCKDCQYCIHCTGLVGAKYCRRNIQYEKEDFFRRSHDAYERQRAYWWDRDCAEISLENATGKRRSKARKDIEKIDIEFGKDREAIWLKNK